MFIAVDIGGSHISSALLNPSNLSLIQASYREQKAAHDLEKNVLLDLWLSHINEKVSGQHIQGLGIAIPGAFDYAAGIGLYDQNKFLSLYQFKLKQYFSENLIQTSQHEIDIQFINDADAFAIGEYWKGAIKESHRALVLTLGTGLGSTFMIHGHCVEHGPGIPQGGKLHDKMTVDGLLADQQFSTRGIIALYKEITTESIGQVKDIADEARLGNAKSLQCFEHFGRLFGQFLRPYILDAQIETLAIGGNIAKAMDLFLPSMKTALDCPEVEIVPTMLAHFAPLYGAVYPMIKSQLNA